MFNWGPGGPRFIEAPNLTVRLGPFRAASKAPQSEVAPPTRWVWHPADQEHDWTGSFAAAPGRSVPLLHVPGASRVSELLTNHLALNTSIGAVQAPRTSPLALRSSTTPRALPLGQGQWEI